MYLIGLKSYLIHYWNKAVKPLFPRLLYLTPIRKDLMYLSNSYLIPKSIKRPIPLLSRLFYLTRIRKMGSSLTIYRPKTGQVTVQVTGQVPEQVFSELSPIERVIWIIQAYRLTPKGKKKQVELKK